jgi:ubiquinone biosynthesis protein
VSSVLRSVLEIPVAVATTLVAVRLLGVRRSWAAITLAGVIGWVSGNLLQAGLDNWDWHAAELSLNTVSLSILFTMMAAVALDLLAKPGTLARGGEAGLIVVSRPLRDLRRRIEPYARYREVIAIARRNGLVPGLRSPSGGNGVGAASGRVPPVALRRTLEQAGVVFVKVGQMASTREDLLPPDLREELSHLQSRVDPALTGALTGVASALLLSIPVGASGAHGTPLTRVFGFLGLGFAAVLLLRVIAAVVRDGYG